MVFHGIRGPFRERLTNVLPWMKVHLPEVSVVILTPLGLIPVGLEDLNPFAHLDAPPWVLQHEPEADWVRTELERLGFLEVEYATVNLAGEGLKQRLSDAINGLGIASKSGIHEPIREDDREAALGAWRLEQGRDKLMTLHNISRTTAVELLEGSTFVVNREGRVKNINTREGVHLFSPRLRDGGLSLSTEGARMLMSKRTEPLPTTVVTSEWLTSTHRGPAVVVVDDDAEPFVRKGRNVFHGFTKACDPWLNPGEACLIVNESGTYIGHGVSQCTASDLQTFSKGIAVKTRGGVGDADKQK